MKSVKFQRMKKTSAKRLSQQLNIATSRGIESVMKAKLISAILNSAKQKGLTHADLALRSGIPRSAVTGILSGSLAKVSLDRVLRITEAAELTAEIRIKEAA
jgi:transcriptional regulator with XRE-family HTH domain